MEIKSYGTISKSISLEENDQIIKTIIIQKFQIKLRFPTQFDMI